MPAQLRARLDAAWDVPVWAHPILLGAHRLSIARNSRSGLQRYYVDGCETDVHGYLKVTAAHEAARHERLYLRQAVA